MQVTRWGIIGPGNIAYDFASDLKLIKSPQQIVSVLGHTPERTNKFAEEFNVPHSYTNFNDFIRNEKPDVVYIATPHPQHFEQTLHCLEKKIAVLCEKPLALNARQANELIGASKKQNTFLMEGMWIRFLPPLQKVISLTTEDKIGNIVSIKASIGYKAPDDPSSRYFDPALGGGSLLDLGIYPIFLSCLFLGRPNTIKAVATLTEKNIDEACSVLLHYNGGQHAMLESSLASQTDLPAEIAGEKGTIKILHPWFEKSKAIELLLYEKDKTLYPCEWEGHGLQYEIQEVLHCLQTNKIESSLMTHDLSLTIVEVMDEIRRQINVTYDLYESSSDLIPADEK
jgi:predicted dehydrogenase